MAAQERIIGGGFLIIGVAIVLVLLYFFTWGGTGSKEAYEQILDEVFPAYEAARKDHDYTAMKAEARKLIDAMEEGGAATVKSYISADATGNRGAASRLHKLLKAGAFARNAEGRFLFGGSWYESRAHRALTELAEAVDTRLKVLRGIRDWARDARAALDEARTGSGKPLAIPTPKGKVQDDVPIVDPNPIYLHDKDLYAVFGVAANDVEAALSTADPGGRATSARLRWNQNIATGNLSAGVHDIPEQAQELTSIAAQIGASAKTLSALPEAADALSKLLARGARLIGSDLAEPHKAAFKENQAAFATGAALVKVLRREEELLRPYLATVRALAEAFKKTFP